MDFFERKILHTPLGRLLMVVVVVAFAAFFISQCSFSHEGEEKQLKEDVDSFATYYYNWKFPDAARYCTPESRIWLRFASTNVHQADVDILKQQKEGASHTITDVDYLPNDTAATVTIEVRNYLRMDTIGKEGRIIPEATFKLPVVYRNKRWLVRMEDLPRSEKKNRD